MSRRLLSEKKVYHLKVGEIPGLINESVSDFANEKSFFHGAALAYYAVFALVPILYLCTVYLGKIVGHDLMIQIVGELLQKEVGIKDVSGILEFMNTLDFNKSNYFMEFLGFVLLLVTGSAFIVCLRHSINYFFDLEINYESRKHKLIQNILIRLFSMLFVTIVTIGFILFYFSQTIILSLSNSFLGNNEFVESIISDIIRQGLSLISNLVLFTLVFKYVNDAVIRWKLAFGGALLTAFLLYIGQLLIKYYLFHFFFGAKSVGIAGTIFILLAWVYYSSQIIFFGAKFISVYARKIGQPIKTKD